MAAHGRDRRHPQGAGLRRLFDEQWSHLLGLLAGSLGRAPGGGEPAAALEAALESLVDGTNRRVRVIGGYRRRLREGVGVLLAHVDEVVDQVPAAVRMDARGFSRDARVRAFFATPEDMALVFGRSLELRAFFEGEGRSLDQAYVLLFMTRRERRGFGVGMQGELLVREVPQTTVGFAEHEVTRPRASEAEARAALKERLFDDFVAYIRRELLRRIAADGGERGAAGADGLSNPDRYLETVTGVLREARSLLHIESHVIHVSHLGVKVDEHTVGAGSRLDLYEVGIAGQPTRVVVIAGYPRTALPSREEAFSDRVL